MLTSLIFKYFNLQHIIPALATSHPFAVYGLLFLIIFIETGLVIMPFLPGDAILFLIGTLATWQLQGVNLILVILLLSLAAILGDFVNFKIGQKFGVIFTQSKFLPQKRLEQAQSFFQNYGARAIILARFTPIMRTIVPFVAGMSRMPATKFIQTNMIGGVTWISLMTLAGFYFGSIPVIKSHFEFVVLAIVILSVLPMLIHRLSNRKVSHS
ncbi:MAG TPA: VTT domain-containing protein [Lactobacillaceae bacterium]|jgi:membrane-associated protein